jgi:hypothetical protein
MKAGKVDSWPGHQRRQPGDEIQRLLDYMRGTVPLRRLELVAHVAILRK